jgi:hypothetical protein
VASEVGERRTGYESPTASQFRQAVRATPPLQLFGVRAYSPGLASNEDNDRFSLRPARSVVLLAVGFKLPIAFLIEGDR